MLNICLVLIVVAGLLFIYYVFFAKKESPSKEKMSNNFIEIINYNTEWCGYSKRFQPIWDEFAREMAIKNPSVKVTDMKCDNPNNKEKCTIPEVEGYPTVVLHKGDTKIVFNDNRSKESLLKFVEQNSK